MIIVLLLVIVFNSISRLRTKIYSDHIDLDYFPFNKKLIVRASEIIKYRIRNYRAYREYKGYGIKNNMRRGKACIMCGNVGLQLYLSDGSKLLIGTQRKQAMVKAMEKLMEKGKS